MTPRGSRRSLGAPRDRRSRAHSACSVHRSAAALAAVAAACVPGPPRRAAPEPEVDRVSWAGRPAATWHRNRTGPGHRAAGARRRRRLDPRPVGSARFGHMADSRGRRRAMIVAVVGAGVATALFAVLPTYATVGVLAPVLFLPLRLVQGVFVGGVVASTR